MTDEESPQAPRPPGSRRKGGQKGKPKRQSKTRRIALAEPGSGREYRGHRLDRFQEDAIEAIEAGRSVVVAAPTGAGKTLIAEYAVTVAMRHQKRVIYTAPIKALSNQKYRDFREAFGNDKVGIMTGDVVLNADAPLVIMTTEIYRNTIFDDPRRIEPVRTVIYDEIHYLDDIERGTVWEESLIFAPQNLQIVALSATIPNLDVFVEWLSWVRKTNVVSIETSWRPVPLEHRFYLPRAGIIAEDKLDLAFEKSSRKTQRRQRHGERERRPPPVNRAALESDRVREVLDQLVEADEQPTLIFSFSRAACEAHAAEACRRHLLAAEEKAEMLHLYDDLTHAYGIDGDRVTEEMRRMVGRGIAYHHAGMLPALKEVIERLFTTGRIKMIFTTETFAVGINMPARSVVFSSLRKFDGTMVRPLRTRDYFQMAGRAGRRGIDDHGLVISVIDPTDMRLGEVKRVVQGEYEPVDSRFDLSYSSILNLWERLRGKLVDAISLSFGAFRASDAERQAMLDKVEVRLEVLRIAGYLDGDEITERGHTAGSIFGYEVQLAELEHAGILRRLDSHHLAALLVTIGFEARKGDWFAERNRQRYRKLFIAVFGVLERFRKAELRAGASDLIKLPEPRIMPAVMAWMRGASLDELEPLTSCGPGDLIRVMRMANQMLRNLKKLAWREEDWDYRERIEVAMELLDRDEVDAEAQLQVE